MVLGDLDSYMQKSEIQKPPTYTIYKKKTHNESKTNVSQETKIILEENIGSKNSVFLQFHFFARSCPDLPTPFIEEAIFTTFYAPAPFIEYLLTQL